MPVLRLVTNGVLPPLFDDDERVKLARHTELLTLAAAEHAEGGAQAAVVAGARRAVREDVQRESMKRLLGTLKERVVLLPFLFDEASTRVGTEILAEVLGSRTIAGR
jgi:hypothetical protein